MTDDSGPDMVLKIPEGNSVGITPELVEYIKQNGRIECYGEMLVPGHGLNSEPAVPIEELEQLADEWEATMHSSPDAQIQSNECAQELRDLIAEYDNG